MSLVTHLDGQKVVAVQLSEVKRQEVLRPSVVGGLLRFSGGPRLRVGTSKSRVVPGSGLARRTVEAPKASIVPPPKWPGHVLDARDPTEMKFNFPCL